ncbi:RHS repeat-associated core domain-containing protein [Sorangium sp. So ce406]|uniref:RHS repeat-associated core domain-containing protein n=1 Tax=Sorangium sp. So ce406 TaxID=3133311 RepID=UPI003F5CA9A9
MTPTTLGVTHSAERRVWLDFNEAGKSRIYDPKLKRVLTPDPLVSAPLFGQSYNRYSYVLNDPLNLVDPTGYEPTGPDCTTCAPWTPRQPPWSGGGGGVTIISGGGGGGDDGNPYTSEWSSDSGDIGPPPPPSVVRSDADGFQGAGVDPGHGSLLVQLVNERARQDRLYYETLQRDTFRVTQWAMVGAGAALLVWSGGYALLALEELSVFGSTIGMTSTQMAAANAASFTAKAVPAILGDVWVLEGLHRHDPGRIADGLMIAASAGASFGEGLGAGPRAGGGIQGGAPKISSGSQVTEEVIRQAMRGAPLASQQSGGVSLPTIQNYVDKLLAGDVAPAIKVDGRIIVYGNRRYIAGRVFGQEPAIQPWAGGGPAM